MEIVWQLSNNGLKLKNDYLIGCYSSNKSDCLLIVSMSHIIELSLSKIITNNIYLESFIKGDILFHEDKKDIPESNFII